MAHPNKNIPSLPLSSQPQLHPLFSTGLFLLLCLLPPHIDALYLNFSSFELNQTDIELEGGAQYIIPSIHLSSPTQNNSGRALYHEPMQLWDVDGNATRLADFTTHFSFSISSVAGYGKPRSGHGLTFVLIRENATLSNNSIGGLLGLFESKETATNYVVAVEFDTYKDTWDESIYHMGIDVNSLRSKKYVNVPGGFIDRGTANVWVVYNSTTKNLSASLTFAEPGSSTSCDVFHIVDLSTVLPQRVRVGFTAATRLFVETHELHSWSFNSTIRATFDTPPSLPPQGPPPSSPPQGKNKVGLVVGVSAGLFAVILIAGVALYWFRSRRNVLAEIPLVESPILHRPEDQQDPPSVDQKESRSPHIDYPGPKRFTYFELSEATNTFDKEKKLGEGGFGEVYEGQLANSSVKMAVKRFKSGSTQGENEYVSEVKIISMLSHRNLVQLKGWCHENGELLLVYEFMPNRSLDFHLFGRNLPLLTWPTRYTIIVDLASALQYLQDGCDPYVLHRDIKSSNIMLNSNFNAKLGDFGMARLTNHDESFKNTVPAGTLGYLAPEVISTGKVSKASDIYSFGVVALEVACGRRPINQTEEHVAEWVWDLYGRGSTRDAVDVRLNGEFNQDQARQLMVVGLWCCHPDPGHRPSIKQVQAVLNFEAAEPNLPPTIPRPTYVSIPMNPSLLSSNASFDTEAGDSSTVSQVYTTSSTSGPP